MKKTILSTLIATLSFGASAANHDHDHEHFSDMENQGGKPATQATTDANNALAKTLNFDDIRVFENNSRGLIKPLDEYTLELLRDRFSNVHKGQEVAANAPDSVNPSLWRQAQANYAANGLYEVRDGIYQVRGTDLAATTFIKSESGWIVYDVLMHKQAMEASLEFFLNNVPEGGDKPVVAMIYSHSHADHFGGSRAVQERFPEVKVYAPHGFVKETVDENILAGNAMSRRAAYQYGSTLGQASERGTVDGALSNGWSMGPNFEITLVAPDMTFPSGDDQKFFEYNIDGVKFVFMDTAGTEAPAGHVAYLPEKNALWTGEMMYQGMHNVYTLRGAKVRDSLKWSKDINEMINAWGGDVEYLFGSHSAPIWGNQEINDFMKLQRDNYGFVHNQTLRLANNGMTLQDIGAKITDELPDSLQQAWHTNGYHGTYSHNARAVYNMYLGYFDMNPANLNPLPVQEEAELFTEAFGGCEKATAFAQTKFDQGEYRFVSSMMDKVVRACDDNDAARMLLADSFEQQGYQAEGAGWRNIFLTGAQELRIGTMPGTPKTASVDVLSEMTVENLLDFMAVRVDSLKAQHTPFTMNLVVTDTGETHFVEMSNGNLSNIAVDKAKNADATLNISSVGINKLLLGQATLDDLLKAKSATVKGDTQVLAKLKGSLVDFDTKFEIVPRPAKGAEVDAALYNTEHKH
ncbi:beta-lactamase [Vibrio vulnificus]|uniref:alkyl/aryl-sulfatase n=1 Tax=Vibrio vulnificus TaxID=672 RepID=UPI0006AD19A8|nr:alkyl sulfatase dimerization domain-containing protein [Vibrio vulnificus]KOS00011.1 beta-lactamase [Vibrio vulnificus]HDY8064378.1 MBL fold metallo-hydrolase [Vibrio vulnificus]